MSVEDGDPASKRRQGATRKLPRCPARKEEVRETKEKAEAREIASADAHRRKERERDGEREKERRAGFKKNGKGRWLLGARVEGARR